MRVAGATLTVGGRNLHLWKRAAFTGDDPELLSNTVNGGQNQFATTEEFTVPQPRRWLVRLNLQFLGTSHDQNPAIPLRGNGDRRDHRRHDRLQPRRRQSVGDRRADLQSKYRRAYA